MQSHAQALSRAVAFYDAHPINEEQILHALAAKGVPLDRVDEEILKDHDQDHFGGTEANDILAAQAAIAAQHLVLDVCSGMGGPARYLAHRIGCRVVGLDFTESRHRGAQRLTQLARLDHLVSFRHGNALEMPFDNATFDVVIGQEAWCHVPDKPRLIAECARVVKPGGVIAFTDILRGAAITDAELERLRQEMSFPTLETHAGYAALLKSEGCSVRVQDDLSAHWARILVDRLAMYRGLKVDTVRKFGEAHFRRWDDTYAFFVGLFTAGKLGGGRLVAWRAAPRAPER
jgi:ubiquinone/menaquinone biosynthesis C-methylase UbiE